MLTTDPPRHCCLRSRCVEGRLTWLVVASLALVWAELKTAS